MGEATVKAKDKANAIMPNPWRRGQGQENWLE